ncbi:hypothetical protein IHE44_0008229 [Lamprotornis superbus]|uniref:Endothelin-2 n=1 Tax=Lamprotornis superbus TaxID=245042 RepID=A0A835NQ67_9PASS|nr:hypothetical protein IHE44_0008229 [Lamprotornis superbus]
MPPSLLVLLQVWAIPRPSRTWPRRRGASDVPATAGWIRNASTSVTWTSSGHTTPYGLGSPPRRRKRSAGRCECSHSRDSICATFCQGRPGYLQSLKLPMGSGASARSLQSSATRPPHHGLLRALRDLRGSSPRSSTRQQRSRRDAQPPALPWEKNIWKKKR